MPSLAIALKRPERVDKNCVQLIPPLARPDSLRVQSLVAPSHADLCHYGRASSRRVDLLRERDRAALVAAVIWNSPSLGLARSDIPFVLDPELLNNNWSE